MPQKALSEPNWVRLTPEQRRRIIGAIARAVRATLRHPVPTSLPPYPGSVPEIDRHIDQLAELVWRSESHARKTQIVKHVCSACPHQFRSRYCPLRPRGGCVLHRCAGPIARAIAAALVEQDAEGEYASC